MIGNGIARMIEEWWAELRDPLGQRRPDLV